jgi:hypothetical protein
MGVTDVWLKQHVVPEISALYNQYKTVGDELALPIFGPVWMQKPKKTIPVDLCNRICFQYEQILLLEESVIPETRGQISVYRVQEQLCIDTVF